ncbi:nitrous oxide reductase accessory protein NosL [Paracoccus sp. Z118]|uniref:nitrous oxide reductase accessory protein NosL n=1 Tax=Paracoccus sp. Z118 TaxID=2851017 RepID=UPI001C2CB371|nr:nitrous oxide reductase accessory protein NosL [Paracoccus sp. Z118]MBV0892369.1 nitrous oxide reductase accessory protein NosL [Paracoccus sp. Z118]
MTALRLTVAAALMLGLAGCKEEMAQDISPVEISAQTLGHFCQMNLVEHPGPKAQVHLEAVPGSPLFFSQVRDAIAFARAPEQIAPILAIYVNDMGADAATWDVPGEGNWIDAEGAFYVVGSAREGGMGAPETVPFGTRPEAEAFASADGGRVLTLDEITDDMVLAPVEMTGEAGDGADGPAADDFEDRLRALSRQAEG